MPYEPDHDCYLGKKAEFRYGLIRQLADWPADTFPLNPHNEATITYSSGSLYVLEVEALVFRQRDIYQSVVERFQKTGLLTEAEASAEKLSLNN